MTLDLISGLTAICLYLTTGILLLRRQSTTNLTHPKKLLWLGLGAIVFHGLSLYKIMFTPVGLNMSSFYSLSLIGWLAALLLVLAAVKQPVEKLGIAIFPLAAVVLSLQFFFPGDRIIAPAGIWQLQSHILFSILSISTIFLAAAQATLLYVQDNHLHKKHPGGFIRSLPALKTMEDLLFQIIIIGFILLSIALLTGILFIDDLFSKGHVHKTILSMFAWIVFATLLYGRYQFGWRGRTAIYWTMGGFGSLLLAYVGTKLVLELLLNR